jgi:FtsZ-binding cell division protein ZapB
LVEDFTNLYTVIFFPFQETKQASNSLHSKVQEMTSGLTSLSLEASELNGLRKKLSEEVQTFQYNVLNTLQRDLMTGMQKAVMSYVESEIAPSKQENAELLGEANEMNQVWTHGLRCSISTPTFRSPTPVSLLSLLSFSLQVFRIPFTSVSAFPMKHSTHNAVRNLLHITRPVAQL